MQQDKTKNKEMWWSYRDVVKWSYGALAPLFVCILFLSPFFSASVYAQEEQLSITIAPPLLQLNLQPGETWSSGISVVNNNRYDTTLYARPVLFKPSGEHGKPVFIDPSGSRDMSQYPDESTLAGWVTVPQNGFTIVREQTYTLPITITVPEDAEPGGHYAAVLIGNEAPEGTVEGGTVNVTSSVAALIFLSVAGEVHEDGRIRDFVTEKSVYEDARAELSLRFENQGNVHVLPQGNIVIYNMFGKERGIIPVNHQQNYGMVLPGSIRKYSFSWTADAGIWDIGRYRAEATIHYGKEQKQSALATTYFYVLPIVPLLEILGVLIGLLFVTGWAIKAYIRRALVLEGVYIQEEQETDVHSSDDFSDSADSVQPSTEVKNVRVGTLLRPVKAGLTDLRSVSTKVGMDPEKQAFEERLLIEKERAEKNRMSLLGFLYAYRYFFIASIIIALGVFAVSMFLGDVLTVERDYSVSEIHQTDSVVPTTR